MTTSAATALPQPNYLSAGWTLKSWLLTRDHKRIAILYMVSVTLFFVLGGLFALLIRLELMTPAGERTMDEVLPMAFGPDDLRHVTEAEG